MSQSAALPDILGTCFDPQGDEIPRGASIIAIVYQGDHEIGRTLYTTARLLKAGQRIKYAGHYYRVIAEELDGGTYRIRVGARPKGM